MSILSVYRPQGLHSGTPPMAKSQGFVQKILAVLMLAIAVVLLVALLYKTKSSSEYSHVNTSLTTLRTMTTPGTASWSGNMMPGNRTYSDNAVGRPDASSSIERRNVCYGGWLHYSDDELRIVVNQFYIDVGYFAAGSRSAMGQIKVVIKMFCLCHRIRLVSFGPQKITVECKLWCQSSYHMYVASHH